MSDMVGFNTKCPECMNPIEVLAYITRQHEKVMDVALDVLSQPCDCEWTMAQWRQIEREAVE